MTKIEKSNSIAKFLADEGFAPKLDTEGDVIFRHEGSNFIIQIYEDDPIFFRLIAPNFWPIESADEEQKAALVASAVNLGTKAAKVFVRKENMWATIEMYCSPIENYQPVFKRSLQALQHAVSRFADRMEAFEGDASVEE